MPRYDALDQGLSGDCTPVVITALVRAPPLWEQVGRPSCALDRKRQDEHHDLSSTIKRCTRACQCGRGFPRQCRNGRTRTKNVIVLCEPFWVPRAEIPLRE